MRNVDKWQLKNCIFMETDTFDSIISEVFGKEYTVDFSLDGLSIYSDTDSLESKALYEGLAKYFDVAEVTSVHMDDCDEVGVWICYKDKPQWLILSDNADCGDLSVYSYKGSNEDCYKRLQALALSTAITAGEGNVMNFTALNGSGEAQIIYKDDNTESFRCIKLDKVTDIEETDGVKESNLDAIPDDIDFDFTACQYALFDIGRE